MLGILIDKYEQEHYSIDYPDPIEAIKLRMEQMGYSQTDLPKVIGLKADKRNPEQKAQTDTRDDPSAASGAEHPN